MGKLREGVAWRKRFLARGGNWGGLWSLTLGSGGRTSVLPLKMAALSLAFSKLSW